jgi:hypothetical protein
MAGPEMLERFYGDVLEELGKHARKGGTGIGAGAVVKRVARLYGIEGADRLPLPRLTREERAELTWLDQWERGVTDAS